MTTMHLAAAAILAVGVGTAVGAASAGADPASDQTDSTFTKAVREKGLRFSSTDSAIDLAQSTCAVLARTESVTSAMRHVQNATGWKDPKDVSDFGSLAVQAYCPSSLPR